jgi:hypothetical protein
MIAMSTTAATHRPEAFDLARLFRTVFVPEPGERVAVLTDLPDPRDVIGLAFLEAPGRDIQRHAYRTLYQGLLAGKADLGLADVAFFAYEQTGGSNLDLPEAALAPDGTETAIRDIFARFTIVLFMGRYSATAPATALAKEYGIRGATMHGVNDIVIATGLAADYEQVSARAERLRRALTGADRMVMAWDVKGRKGGPERVALTVELGRQEAQKSHGLVRRKGDIANLPAGEVYFVPTGAEGLLPRKLEGAVAIYRVAGGRIEDLVEVVSGSEAAARAIVELAREDPATARITELGLGTQSLPFAGTDIQDEKIIGTAHLATGRSDHLGGDVGPQSFKLRRNARHEDILYSPNKTPEIALARVEMERAGERTLVLEGGRPAPFIERLL